MGYGVLVVLSFVFGFCAGRLFFGRNREIIGSAFRLGTKPSAIETRIAAENKSLFQGKPEYSGS